ncbi:monovalent cation/H(+) antiporter subunit G [Metabacillus fastidiosus]|uniref:Monovalent cation/H(+) antiporter subunit G n=1 Tax=Metabacillus fastidiosus TaxID=1458 RepID=A0ABU6P0Y2_9BACI|nr:monovalent cation/H(+) antiporter subunit G [Metabacillus fastidiosus]MED4403017.1 monovalent cation/H(+) antiporter subunit G [Metabacillus fastidiosus]MED4455247.1 monovalent cation/H(+) antiporter subunit G [Metabacillus fastidiosus]MED4461435.1 monovalent cation/H(+) antiporter subunit G [Metabacillus fastidiosus]
MIEISKFIVGYLILQGAILSLIAAIGVIKLPDPYTRNHAASKNATLGIMSILIGVFLYFYFIHGEVNSRILLAILFIFITAPVAGHLISRAAYNSGVPLWKNSVQDDLKEAKEGKIENRSTD